MHIILVGLLYASPLTTHSDLTMESNHIPSLIAAIVSERNDDSAFCTLTFVLSGLSLFNSPDPDLVSALKVAENTIGFLKSTKNHSSKLIDEK